MNVPPLVSFPPEKHRPCFGCYDQPFMVGNYHYKEGVYYHDIEEEKDAAGNVSVVLVDRWICSVVRVLCIVRTDAGNGHAYLLEYIPHGEAVLRRAVLSQALLLGRGEEALKELRDLGVSVLGCHAKLVRQYLDSRHLNFSNQKTPDDFWTSVKVVGWAPVGERFVLPNEIIGSQTGVWFAGKTDTAQYKKNGDFSAWQNGVALRCQDNPYLIVALCCAFAGPILEPLNIPGLGIHYFGDSTTGKSTSLAVSSSVWGPDKFMISWRTTINGLEIQAVCRSSTLMPVDESHQVDPRVLDASVYMLLNGAAKARMNKDTSARDIEHWRICVLSSGERSIETHQSVAKIDHKVGQTVRIIDVPVLNGEHGLFANIHGAKNGAEFADSLREQTSKHYGHAGPAFVSALIQHCQKLQWRPMLETTLVPFGGSLSAQDARVARCFAVVALAGELAITWDILPWTQGDSLRAALEIFNRWKATQPQSLASKEVAQILKAIRDFIESREADFSDADWTPDLDQYGRLLNPQPVIHDRAGYWKEIGGNRLYCFNAEGLARASSVWGQRKVLEVLESAGALFDKDCGRHSKKIWIPQLKRSLNFYMVNPDKLELNI